MKQQSLRVALTKKPRPTKDLANLAPLIFDRLELDSYNLVCADLWEEDSILRRIFIRMHYSPLDSNQRQKNIRKNDHFQWPVLQRTVGLPNFCLPSYLPSKKRIFSHEIKV